jgi:Baseplate J-like protein
VSQLLLPDPKAGAVAFPSGYEACGCCEGVLAATPQPGYNRIGLSAIRYRIGDHAQFQASLIAGISSSDWPALAGLRTRDASDFTMGLIDAFAMAADVITFYQERIANESFLRTASERVSMQELGRLIGYRLKPGLAAETLLAFALETPPTPPAALPPEPGNFVTGVPSTVMLNTALKVQSVPGPEEKPQTFETVESIEARPEWSAIRPWMSEVRRPGRGSNETFLAGVRTGLKAGDALLLLDDDFRRNRASNRWDLRLLDSVQVDVANDRTRVTWKRGLGSVSPWMDPAQAPEVFALRKRASAYGHNAPKWRAMLEKYRLDYCSGVATCANDDKWPNFMLSPSGATTDGGHVDLDSVVAEISAGSFVALAKGDFNQATETSGRTTYVELFEVASTNEVSRDDFALSGKVSRLRLRGDNYDQFQWSVRETTVFAQSEPLAFAPYPVEAAVRGDQVPVAVSADGLQPGRRLVVRGAQARTGAMVAHACTLVGATPVDATRCTLEIDPPLPTALKRSKVVVFANVALATHGESVSQILGNGDASMHFQSFELKQLPLTHRAAPTESGTQSELTLRVGDIAWNEVPSLYARARDERAFRLDVDEQGRSLVRFGDGVNGARLPSGVNNVRATYRKGIGAEGNVRAEALTQASTRPLGLKSVTNPLPASGGTDAEGPDAARQTMPLTVRTLGRAVSVLDYADFARAFAGIAKAQASVLRLAAGPTVVVTVAGADGAVLDTNNPVWQNLLAALQASGDPHVPLRLLAHQASTFRVGLKVKVDAAYDSAAVLVAVETALRAHYAFDTRELGQPVQQSDLIACAHSVAGVVAIDLDLLYGGTQPLAQTLPSRQVRLLASRMRAVAGVPRAAELLTLDEAPFDRLEVMP